ncbi:phosphopyruvate hydratase [Candidatus Gracilibacteria bacterium]|nr:phosphopyruvate hydratase [Candidatus Gracilibacteria bacterium]
MALITNINARWILDSRGLPTIQCELTLDNQGKKSTGTASVPSGASTGSYEALELRDNSSNFHGKGVDRAINNINTNILNHVINREFSSADEIDKTILQLDKSTNKSELGANSVLAVSMAAHRAFAESVGVELWQYLRRLYFSQLPATNQFPRLMCNLLNGGAHASNGLSIQEFMIIPNTETIESDIQSASEIYHNLKIALKNDNYSTSLGDEGGFAPKFNLENIIKSQSEDTEETNIIELNPTKVALKYLIEACEKSNYPKCQLAMDCAANEFLEKNEENKEIYKIDGTEMSRSELAQFYNQLSEEFPIISIEDGFAEDDILGWEILTEILGKKINLIGDDLFVTNPNRFKKIGLHNNIANGVLIKLNQIGSVLETCQMINLAKENNYITAVSHRSGETTDSFISDLAFAAQSEFIKLGAPARGERVAKYNRLLEIKDNIQ